MSGYYFLDCDQEKRFIESLNAKLLRKVEKRISERALTKKRHDEAVLEQESASDVMKLNESDAARKEILGELKAKRKTILLAESGESRGKTT